MYNEQFKETYISNKEYINMNLRNYLTCQFNKSAETEERLGKDLYDFTVNEIIDYYKSLFSGALETLLVLNSQFAQYTRYALARNLVKDSQNHYEELDNEILYTCVNIDLMKEKIMTRKEILNKASLMPNAFEKFLLLAPFEGISGNNFIEISNLSMENFNGNEVHLCTGRVLTVSNELVRFAEEAAAEYQYMAYGKDGSTIERKFRQSDFRIIKDMFNVYVSDEERDRIKVYHRYVKIREMHGICGASIKALNESGRLAMIKRFMKEDHTDAKTTILNHREIIEYTFGTIASMTRYLVKYSSYLDRE